MINEVTSGGATFNDSFMHAAMNNVPFGGVGESGTGSYRGKASFDTFTHFRTVAETPLWLEKSLRVRYQPYDWGQLRFLKMMTESKPNFDRSGNVVRGLGYWMKLVLGLGGQSAKGACIRWLIALAGWWLIIARRR